MRCCAVATVTWYGDCSSRPLTRLMALTWMILYWCLHTEVYARRRVVVLDLFGEAAGSMNIAGSTERSLGFTLR